MTSLVAVSSVLQRDRTAIRVLMQLIVEQRATLEVGKREFGRRHFMERMSVFTSPPLFQVLHGREDLGQVDALSFAGGAGRPRVLLLGGRSWRVTHVDWNRRVAFVERVEGRGASR